MSTWNVLSYCWRLSLNSFLSVASGLFLPLHWRDNKTRWQANLVVLALFVSLCHFVPFYNIGLHKKDPGRCIYVFFILKLFIGWRIAFNFEAMCNESLEILSLVVLCFPPPFWVFFNFSVLWVSWLKNSVRILFKDVLNNNILFLVFSIIISFYNRKNTGCSNRKIRVRIPNEFITFTYEILPLGKVRLHFFSPQLWA